MVKHLKLFEETICMPSSNLKPCMYDYNVESAYKKLVHLVGNIVLFRCPPEKYTCGKLVKVKVIQFSSTKKFSINIELEGLSIDFRYKPSIREIKEYFQRFDKMSEEEKTDYVMSQYGREPMALARTVQKLMIIDEKAKSKLSETPRWKILKRRKIKQEINRKPEVKKAAEDFVEASEDYVSSIGLLGEGDTRQPTIEFHYPGPVMNRIYSKDMIESIQIIK